MIDRDPTSGAVRLDADGLAALLAAAGEVPLDEAGLDQAGLDQAGLRPAAGTIGRADVAVDLVVAGESILLRHQAWVDAQRAVLVLGVRPGLHQVLVLPPAHLAAALVRVTRMRPRRTGDRAARTTTAAVLGDLMAADPALRLRALHQVGARFAWRLVVDRPEGSSSITATDGPDGLFLADPVDEVLLPVSNTTAYRIFSTVLTAEEPAPAQ